MKVRPALTPADQADRLSGDAQPSGQQASTFTPGFRGQDVADLIVGQLGFGAGRAAQSRLGREVLPSERGAVRLTARCSTAHVTVGNVVSLSARDQVLRLSAVTDIARVADDRLVRRQGSLSDDVRQDMQVRLFVVDDDPDITVFPGPSGPEQTAVLITDQLSQDLLGSVGWSSHIASENESITYGRKL
jgi:hypothetical protein